MQAGVCLGYVTALADLLRFGSPVLGKTACLPQTGVTPEAMADMVRKYLENRPKERQAAAVVLVADALGKAFPCSA